MVKELPPGWAEVELGEIAHIKSGITLGKKRNPDQDLVELPYLRVANVQRGRLDLSTIKTVLVTREEAEALRLQVGDILMNEGGDRDKLGRGWVWDGELPDCLHQNHVFRVRPLDKGIQPKFISHYANEIGRHFFEKMGKQSVNLASINQTMVAKLPIPLPPLPEQHRIVERIEALLAKGAKAKAALDTLPALLDRYRQSLLAAAFCGDLTADWRDGEGISTWRPVVFSELFSGKAGNGLSVRGSDQPPGIPALKLSAIRNGRINYDEVRYLPIPRSRAEKLFIRIGDFFVSRGNGSKHLVARCAVATEPLEDIIFPDTMIRFRIDQTQVNLSWLRYVWESPQVRAEIELRAKTTAGIWKVSQGDLGEVPMLLPPLPEQKEISRRLIAAFSGIEKLERTVEQTTSQHTTLTQSILAKAFRGELVPQDPADESASVLLARIRAERMEKPKRTRQGTAVWTTV